MQYVKMPAFKVVVDDTARTMRELVEIAFAGQWPGQFPRGMSQVHFQVQSNAINVCYDNSIPTVTAGMEYTSGAEIRQITSDLDKVRFIRSGAMNADMVIFAGYRDDS